MLPIGPRWSTALLLAVLGALFAFVGGWHVGSARQRAESALQAARATALETGAVLALVQAQGQEAAQVLPNYFTQLERFNAPAPVVVERVLRFCPQQLRQRPAPADAGLPVPAIDPGTPPDAAAPPDAVAGELDQLGSELIDAVRNGSQLDALQALIRAHTEPANPVSTRSSP